MTRHELRRNAYVAYYTNTGAPALYRQDDYKALEAVAKEEGKTVDEMHDTLFAEAVKFIYGEDE